MGKTSFANSICQTVTILQFIASVGVCVGLCQHYGSSLKPAEPNEIKLGIKIPWDTRIVCGHSMGNTSYANSHNYTQDY